MPRYKLTIEYDGSPFAGWQRQAASPSVQQAVEEAVYAMSGEEAQAHCAGRTDAGVHAIAQVAHVDLVKSFTPYQLRSGLNIYLLPHPVSILSVEEVDSEFHARFSATSRSYFYRIVNRPSRLALDALRAWHVFEELDAPAMHEAAQVLLGNHDFTSFRSSECQSKSPVKTLDMLNVTRVDDEIHIFGKARSFLHHQMRNMVGSLYLAGNGKWSKDDMRRALEARNRSAAGQTAPPQGLYLTQVGYNG